MTEEPFFEFKFDPKLIKKLGIQLYSQIPPVLAELVANSYDADATKVKIEFCNKGRKKIIVKDNGNGMTSDEIQNKFLIIGRDRREEGDAETPGGRKVIGRKGLGKLSFFGIVKKITIKTVKDETLNQFSMDWDEIEQSEGSYRMKPSILDRPVKNNKDGTEIILENILRKTDFDVEALAKGLARLFIFGDNFSVSMKSGRKKIVLNNNMRYENLEKQFSWTFPEDFLKVDSDYQYADQISGEVITTSTPIPPNTNARGVALFSRGKLVQNPDYFLGSTSSHFYSYLSGVLSIDFIEGFENDVISTNRQEITWEHDEGTRDLRDYLSKCIKYVEREWRMRRPKKVQDEVDIEDQIESWPPQLQSHLRSIRKKLNKFSDVISSKDLVRIFSDLSKIIEPDKLKVYRWVTLHEELKDALEEHYAKENYSQAAYQGYLVYKEKILEMVREAKPGYSHSDSERKLMTDAFEYQNGKSPILCMSTLSTEREKKVLQGYGSLSKGLISVFRNRAAHHPERSLPFHNNDYLDIVSFISFLFSGLDQMNAREPEEKRDS